MLANPPQSDLFALCLLETHLIFSNILKGLSYIRLKVFINFLEFPIRLDTLQKELDKFRTNSSIKKTE